MDDNEKAVNDKAIIARFLDLAAAHLQEGYAGGSPPPRSSPPAEALSPPQAALSLQQANSSSQQANSSSQQANLRYPPQRGVIPPVTPLSCTPPESAAAPAQPSGNTSGELNANLNSGTTLESIAGAVHGCQNCPLAARRKNPVPGEGVTSPLALVIGEAPGADEDASGRPFVGAAGALLDKMLEIIGLSRQKNCFIANIVKCRPPGNRDPEAREIEACIPFLRSQIECLKPKVILCAGSVSAKTLLGTSEGITRLRGLWKTYRQDGANGIPLLPTFHPSYLLRDAAQKAFAWEDMKSLCRRLAELDPAYESQTAALRAARKI